MRSEATIVFGVGATKAGTTWLYRYFRQHPEVHAGSIKETHFFDSYDLGTREQHLARLHERRFNIIAKVPRAGTAHVGVLRSQLLDVERLTALLGREEADLDAYLDYVSPVQEGQRVSVDITPSYGLLSVDRFSQMAGLGGGAKFIYILRDPVSRLWSQIRMKASRLGDEWRAAADRIFEQFTQGKHEQVAERGDYRRILGNLQKAVQPDNLHVMFYEEMFTNRAVRNLCDFLGVSPAEAEFSRRYHAGPKASMTPEQVETARRILSDQYDYTRVQMGRLPDAWTQNLVRA